MGTNDDVLKQANLALEIPEIWEDLLRRAKAIAVESVREN